VNVGFAFSKESCRAIHDERGTASGHRSHPIGAFVYHYETTRRVLRQGNRKTLLRSFDNPHTAPGASPLFLDLQRAQISWKSVRRQESMAEQELNKVLVGWVDVVLRWRPLRIEGSHEVTCDS
jgi:hypothetical protein